MLTFVKNTIGIGGYLRAAFVIAILSLILGGSVVSSADPFDNMRRFTRDVEFDFSEWTVDALFKKAVFSAMGVEKFLSTDQQTELIRTYLDQVALVERLQGEMEAAIAAPTLADRETVVSQVKNKLTNEVFHLKGLAGFSEAVIEQQVEQILNKLGFGIGGQIFPPVLYQVSDLPLNLIVSPRTEIRTVFDINLQGGLDTLEKESIENGIFTNMDYASLVEPIGGLSAYPTMVMQTTNLNWLLETVVHEWVHNWLVFRPLGLHYNDSPQTRTMNETTASLFGSEVGERLVAYFYPKRLPIPPAPKMHNKITQDDQNILMGFDFRAEMRETRIKVDELLASGAVEEAEGYMEERREYFWENGYQLRKINQAYFAFYGSYNDVPGGGAAGSDPVGPAVRKVWAESINLRSFLQTMGKFKSYEDLQEMLGRVNN